MEEPNPNKHKVGRYKSTQAVFKENPQMASRVLATIAEVLDRGDCAEIKKCRDGTPILSRGKYPADDAVPWQRNLPKGFLTGKLQPCSPVLVAKLQEGKAAFVRLFFHAVGKQEFVNDRKGRFANLLRPTSEPVAIPLAV